MFNRLPPARLGRYSLAVAYVSSSLRFQQNILIGLPICWPVRAYLSADYPFAFLLLELTFFLAHNGAPISFLASS